MIYKRHNKGFTIVELLIVVVIIAILATITIVVYTGIQQRSKNSAVAATVTSYVKALMLSAADKGSYPVVPTAAGCLDGSTTCWNGTSASTTSNLVSALTPIMGSLPPLPQSAYNYYASYGGYYIVFTLADASNCPIISGTIPQASSLDTNGNRQCRVSLPPVS